MKVADSTFVTPTAVPPVIPTAVEAVRPIVDGGRAARDRRDTAEQQQGKGTSFRAALDAASVGGLGEAFAAFSGTSAARTDAPRPERRPTGRVELDAKEADSLYRAAQIRSAPAGDLKVAREHFAASRQYAQRFFSVDGTYAARGESLEMRA